MKSMRIRTLAGRKLFQVIIALAATGVLHATLTESRTVPLGSTATFQIAAGPFSDCFMSGTVTNSNPAVARVSPFPNYSSGQIQVFTIIPLTTGNTVIRVDWKSGDPSSGSPSPYCPDGLRTENITVVPLVVPPTWGFNINTAGKDEPVSTATGEVFGHDGQDDLALGGPLPMVFRRYYASYLAANSVTSALGPNWMHTFDLKLAATGTTATVTLFRGKTVQFAQSGTNWRLTSVERRPYQLIAASGGFQFLDPDSDLIYSFNSGGALTGIQDRNGNTLTVTPAAGGAGPSQISDGLGRTLTFTYTGANLTKVQDQSGRSVSFEYTSGALSAWTDANGKRWSFGYASAGSLTNLMTAETRPLGNKPFTQQFDAQGRVSSQSDSFSNTAGFTYSSSTNGSSVSEPLGVTLTFAHDTQLNVTSISDPSGGSSRYTYDASNRPLSMTNRLGARSSIAYDAASGLAASYTDELGDTTTFRYASSSIGGFTFFDLSNMGFADGTSISLTRDSKGNVASLTDQAGRVWQLTRNGRGQLATSTNPSGGVTTLSYASDGTLSSVQLPSGDTTRIAYDSAMRPSQVTGPDATSASFQYDGLDNLVKATDQRAYSTTAAFDDNGNLKSVTDALSAVAAVAYDTDDRAVSVTNALGKITKAAWDALSRLQSVTDPTGVSVTYSYDKLNHPTGAVDAAGKGFTYATDAEGRLTGVTDALSRTATVTRDALGRVTAVATPNNEKFSAVYDRMGRVTSATDPLGRSAQYAYDARGLFTGATLPGGVAATLTRNELGLITSETDPDGNAWLSTFDKQGRLVSTTDPLGQAISLQYDSRQRVSLATLPLGTAQYSYDAAGNLTGVKYSDGAAISFTYDADNRLTGGTGLALSYDAAGRLIGCNGLQIAYDDAGRIAAVTYAAGKTVRYTYDNRGLLVGVQDWIGGSTTLAYDAAHQLTSMIYPNGVREDYTYDANGRSTAIRVTNGATAISSIALQRDALGRVTGATRSAPNVPTLSDGYTPLAYDAASQSFAATYDALGRETGDAMRTYTWDLASRVASYKGLADGAAAFTYDALGQRISRTLNGAAENYVLNFALPMASVAVVQSGGSDQRYYIWLPDGVLLCAIDAAGNKRHFYHFDESGSTNFLTDDSGAVSDSYAITPYGESAAQRGSTPNPFTFQGALGVMQEGNTGLYYMRARYYDSVSARFLSRDPVASTDPRAMNPYQFALGNPVEGGDPTGEKSPTHLVTNRVEPKIRSSWMDENGVAHEIFVGFVSEVAWLSPMDTAGSAGAVSSPAPVSTPPLERPFGGPITEDRLWYWGSGNRNRVEKVTGALLPQPLDSPETVSTLPLANPDGSVNWLGMPWMNSSKGNRAVPVGDAGSQPLKPRDPVPTPPLTNPDGSVNWWDTGWMTSCRGSLEITGNLASFSWSAANQGYCR